MKKYQATTSYIEKRQLAMLTLLSQRTKVPVAEYIRQGINKILEKNDPQLTIPGTD